MHAVNKISLVFRMLNILASIFSVATLYFKPPMNQEVRAVNFIDITPHDHIESIFRM